MLPMFKTIISSLFKKPATVQYPFAPKVNDPLVRGQIEIELDKCIYCGICKRDCPTHAIDVDRNARKWSIAVLSCIICGYCVEKCPKKCLHMSNVLPGASYEQVTKEFCDARIPSDSGNNQDSKPEGAEQASEKSTPN